ncbi:MAG: class I SAM-dependent methyltransferase [Bacteroidetes bacterium]|nr:class I SAM-dependent methyltransferase [Bacteroidota bacterium]
MLDIEFSTNKNIQHCMKTEYNIIRNVSYKSKKNVFDIGAGYGRLTPFLSALFKTVYAIEIEEKMFHFLKMRNNQFKNCTSFYTDFFQSSILINTIDKNKNVYILAQNTFGTFNKNIDEATNYISKLLKKGDELIITFFKAESLKNEGLEIYKSLRDMLGNPDFEKISYYSGDYYSDTGYYSKWMTSLEVDLFIKQINPKTATIEDSSFYKTLHLKL